MTRRQALPLTARWPACLVLMTAAWILSGCDRLAPEPAGAAVAGRAGEPAPSASAADGARLNAYVGVHNILVNAHGIEGTRQDYERAVLDTRRKTGPGFSASWLPRAIDELRAAQAMPGGGSGTGLDAAGRSLLQALESLHRAVGSLPAYFDSRAWRDDGGAALMAGNAEATASLDAAEMALRTFNDALERSVRARTANRLAALKESGDAMMYSAALAMDQAKTLVTSTQEAVDRAGASAPSDRGRRAARLNPPDWTAPDAALAALDKTLVDARAEIARRRDIEKPGLQNPPHREFAYVVDALTSMTGAFRDFRSDGSQTSADTMVRSYNNAVGYYGRTPTETYRRE